MFVLCIFEICPTLAVQESQEVAEGENVGGQSTSAVFNE